MKFYIEAGANDGIFQSRSLHLANNPEYTGILVEPLPSVYSECCQNRPYNTKIYNCALVDANYSQDTIDINLHYLYSAMATINQASSQKYNGIIKVPARTLESILQENNITNIDAFYLDVEGYEYNVLQGINFDKRHFKYIEIELHYTLTNISKEEEIQQHDSLLSKFGYTLVEENTDEGNLKLIFTK
jgi:FkbM family methyltransferase